MEAAFEIGLEQQDFAEQADFNSQLAHFPWFAFLINFHNVQPA